MRLASAFVILGCISTSGAANDNLHPGLRGKLHDSKQFTGAQERILAETKKSKDPSDPPFEGDKPDTTPPPDGDIPALEITLGEANGGYDGELYSDTMERPADFFPEHVAEMWEGGNGPGTSKNPNMGDNNSGNENGNGSDNGNGAKSADFEIERGKIRCIVEYKPGVKSKSMIMKGLVGISTHYEFDEVNTVVISIQADALNGLKNNPNILNIYPDSRAELITPVDRGTDRSFFDRHGRSLAQSTPYGVNMLEVNWLKRKGEKIKVCVLDTGYTRRHPDLPYSVDWVGVPDANNPPSDSHGHGTHVAGTIAALDNNEGVVGVAPSVGLVIGMPGHLGGVVDGSTHISDTIDGIRRCRDEGATVVNMSYGGFSFSQWQSDRLDELYNDDNMLLVAAAGNHGDGFDSRGNRVNPTLSSYPASYNAVLSVAAVNSDGVRADFSAKNNAVNIAAPGVGVRSTTNNGSYDSWNGTSMASPHVAGVAALVWSIMPWLTAPQLRSFLLSAAQYESLAFTGAGLVNTGFYPIMLQQSGKCLDNWGGYAKLYTCGIGYSDQLFTYDYFNSMIVGSDGKCLGSSGSYNGASVTYTTCNKNDSAQRWNYSYSTKEFKNTGGFCLDNHGAYQFQNNGVVHLWGCHGSSNQKWLLGKDYETKLFQDNNMNAGGKMYRTPGAGRWYSMPTAIKNDRLTRTIIPQGFAFQYYEHTSYRGWNNIFGSHDFPINLYMGGHNDSVSSFKVQKLPDGKVRLCKHSDCSSNYYDCTWVQNYASMPSAIGNDQLTRVLIPRGYQFQYFQHGSFGGWNRTFGSCASDINLSMGGHNDAVSSFKIKILDC